MGKSRPTWRINIQRKVFVTTLPGSELHVVEELLARMIAAAYTEEHPELFRSFDEEKNSKQQVSGPSAAAAAVTGAPPVNAGGPEKRMELEHYDNPCKTDNRPKSL